MVKVVLEDRQLSSRIDKWKNNLIDLSKRNTLLNFKPNPTNSIQIFDEPSVLFKKLVVDEQPLNCEELSTVFAPIEEAQNFNKILLKLKNAARTRMSEQGINISYLAFGLLKWKESSSHSATEWCTAPLLLTPVVLKRDNVNHPFTLHLFEEEIVINPFLAHMLREQHGIRLPLLPEEASTIELAQLWGEVRKLISKLKEWTVEEEVYLSLFSFNKLVMYKDMENYKDQIESHPLIREMVGVAGDDSRTQRIVPIHVPTEEKMDEEVSASDCHHILDADSSQYQAVLAAKHGMSFVLQGPPGTGKSQTISNIIADSLANNKKILFVSEKMAALEVVRSRLEKEGLGDFCLEMHSQKANKRQVLDELNQVLHKRSSTRKVSTEIYNQVNQITHKLNAYSGQIHLIREPYRKTVYEMHGILASLEEVPELMVQFHWHLDDTSLESIYALLTDLERYGSSMYRNGFHPWEGFRPESYSLELKSNVKAFLNTLWEQLSKMSQTAAGIKSATGLKVDTLQEFQQAVHILDMALDSPLPPSSWFDINNLEQIKNDVNKYSNSFTMFLEDRTKLQQVMDEGILTLPLSELYEELFVQNDALITLIPEAFRVELLIDNRSQWLLDFDLFMNRVTSITAELSDVAGLLGMDRTDHISDLQQLLSYISLLNRRVVPTEEWFDLDSFSALEKDAYTVREIYAQMEEIRSRLLSIYKPSFIEINADQVSRDLVIKEYAVHSFRQGEGSLNSILYDSKTELLTVFQEYFHQYDVFLSYKNEFELLLGIQLNTLSSIDDLITIMNTIERNPRPLDSWFHLDHYYSIQALIREAKELSNQYQSELQQINSIFENDVFDQRIYGIYERCEGEYQSIFRAINNDYKRDTRWLRSHFKNRIADKLDWPTFQKYIRGVRRVMEYRKFLLEQEDDIKNYLGWHYKGVDTQWEQIEQALADMRELMEWHEDRKVSPSLRELLLAPAGKVKQLISKFNQLKQIPYDLKQSIRVILTEFPHVYDVGAGNHIDSVNLVDLDATLRDQWSNANEYFHFIELFKVHYMEGTEMNVRELKQHIEELANLNQRSKVLSERYQEYANKFGSAFAGKDTDWDGLISFMNEFTALHQVDKPMPEAFKQAMLSEQHKTYDEQKLQDEIRSIEKEMLKFKHRFPELFIQYEGKVIDWPITQFVEIVTWLQENIQGWHKLYSHITPHFFTRDLTFVDIRKSLEQAVHVYNSQQVLNGELDYLKLLFGDQFTGYSTQWQRITDALTWTVKWHEKFADQIMPEHLLDYVSAEGKLNKKELRKVLLESARTFAKTDYHRENFNSYFDSSVIFEKASFLELDITALLQFTEARIQSIDLLEEWIKYQRLESSAQELGMGEFIEEIRKQNIGGFSLRDLFQKRFTKLWLDQIYRNEPLLYEFDAEQMNDEVATFRQLDRSINASNVQRIIDNLESSREEAIQSPELREALQMMRKEIGKKQGNIPIRRLVSGTAPLFLELKPCLLMSPLSVSQFLDAAAIQFDLVIFDEASQIFSEDAIGSIIRGKQVIVVGDTKQLPPTNFFHGGMMEEEVDDELEEGEDIHYESILDECAHVLPPMELRWHYRSKHESLITFSNHSFYHNNLVTFPSSDNSAYLGTEFVYVKEGVYTRGGSKTNKREAEHIAGLVVEHFKHHPGLSLGVIAFSQAQAAAIEAEVANLIHADSQYNSYIQEGVHEEFFIKSLENVQGDERDVIFLSVGYAKTADGRLHYNFGPLSKTGGERRLNVAITRAKVHMKLISSFQPSELSDSKIANNTGLKYLKEYMQTVLMRQLSKSRETNAQVQFDSLLEQDVYKAIVDMGYTVETQVGNSGYRIDLAVIDPLDSNRYLLGIECDGAAYHSSTVARDRERLRPQVLESLGWNIYRIWSQEWFKKRELEGQRLRNYIESLRVQV